MGSAPPHKKALKKMCRWILVINFVFMFILPRGCGWWYVITLPHHHPPACQSRIFFPQPHHHDVDNDNVVLVNGENMFAESSVVDFSQSPHWKLDWGGVVVVVVAISWALHALIFRILSMCNVTRRKVVCMVSRSARTSTRLLLYRYFLGIVGKLTFFSVSHVVALVLLVGCMFSA